MKISTIPFLRDEVARFRNELKLEPDQIRAGTDAFASLAYLEMEDAAAPTIDGVHVVEDATLPSSAFEVDAPVPAP